MLLHKELLPQIASAASLSLPAEGEWQLPEKVLQFGTGVLLRGLTDYYINKANRQQVFNGRVVVVKSTSQGSADAFEKQDGLYTHCIKGIVNGEVVESYTINAAISRVLSASHNWQQILDCAANPHLQIIVSNTTEVGISLLESDSIHHQPPRSFPGKLLAFLHARYEAFGGSAGSGMVIIPTELIVDNGSKLKDIVVALARINQLSGSFIDWLLSANDFCSSLVDRIVPGALPADGQKELQERFGYEDQLAIMSEPYSLWAIEANLQRTRHILSFSAADEGMIITPDIYKYRELKLRLLNGTHTFSCGLGFLYGYGVVNNAMQDAGFSRFINGLLGETIPCVTASHITEEEAQAFAGNVVSRFANPFIQHKWLSITLQYTGKIKSRCVPLIQQHYLTSQAPPQHMALGLAAWLLFMKAVRAEEGNYYGEKNGETYRIQDDSAGVLNELWKHNSTESIAAAALADSSLWGENLAVLPGLSDAVGNYLVQMQQGVSLDMLLMPTTRNRNLPTGT